MRWIRYAVPCALLVVAAGFSSAVALAASGETQTLAVDRCVKVDVERLALIPRGAPDCLAIKPSGVVSPIGSPGQCVALDAKRAIPTLVDAASPECAKIESIVQVEVIKDAAKACFGFEPRSGAIAVRPGEASRCLGVDATSGLLTLVGSTSKCIPIDARTGTLSPVGAVAGPPSACLRSDKASGEIVVPAGDWSEQRWVPLRLRVGVRYAEREVPEAGVGTLIPNGAGSEVDAILRRQDAQGMSIDVSLVGSQFGAWEVEYFEGDATARAAEPVGGAQVGFVYHQASPGGSFGLNTGRNGGEFKLDTDVTVFNLNYRPPFSLYRSRSPDCKLDIRPELAFSHVRTEYEGWSQSIRVPGIYSQTRQEVEENRFGLGLRGHYARKLGYDLVGRIVANLDVVYRDAELKSWQRNVCDAPGCSPAATFDASVRDSDSGLTWEVGVKAALEYPLGRDSRLGFQVGYRYLPETAALQNPTRTINLDRTPYLKDASAQAFQVGVSYAYSF